MSTTRKGKPPIPISEELARVGYEAVCRFYQNPDNLRAYYEWLPSYLAEQKAKGGEEKSGSAAPTAETANG